MTNSLVLKAPGSWSQMGWRVGPSGGSDAGNYGEGMPYGSLFTYAIKPETLVAGNVVSTTAGLTAAAQWVPLNASSYNSDTIVSFYYGSGPIPYGSSATNFPPQMQNGKILTLQFQYPCCLTFTSSNALGNDSFTVFGYDWYGQPMQSGTRTGATTTVAAFYGVTGIWYKGTLAAGTTLSVSTSKCYGLPYVLRSSTQIVQYAETGSMPGTVAGQVFTPANYTSIGGVADVRGTVEAVDVDGAVESVTTYYVEGADPAQAELVQVSQGLNASGLPWATGEVSVPSFGRLIGSAPFYQGHP